MVAFLLEAKNGGFAGGFFLACEAFSENVRPFIHRLRLLSIFCFFFFGGGQIEVGISSRTLNSTLYARISLQWLSELRRLWLKVP